MILFRSGVAGGPGDLHYRDQLQVVQDLQGLLRRRGPRFPQVQVENRGSYVQGLLSRRRLKYKKNSTPQELKNSSNNFENPIYRCTRQNLCHVFYLVQQCNIYSTTNLPTFLQPEDLGLNSSVTATLLDEFCVYRIFSQMFYCFFSLTFLQTS